MDTLFASLYPSTQDALPIRENSSGEMVFQMPLPRVHPVRIGMVQLRPIVLRVFLSS